MELLYKYVRNDHKKRILDPNVVGKDIFIEPKLCFGYSTIRHFLMHINNYHIERSLSEFSSFNPNMLLFPAFKLIMTCQIRGKDGGSDDLPLNWEVFKAINKGDNPWYYKAFPYLYMRIYANESMQPKCLALKNDYTNCIEWNSYAWNIDYQTKVDSLLEYVSVDINPDVIDRLKKHDFWFKNNYDSCKEFNVAQLLYERDEYDARICPECGMHTTGNFCSNCGHKMK